MVNVTSPEKVYLQSHPNATLQEYIDYNANIQKNKLIQETERLRNRDEWYNSHVGKYFIINFNGHSKIAGKLEKMRNGDLCFNPVYSVYTDSETPFKISLEQNRCVNKCWLQNPFEISTDRYVKCKEVSEEEFTTIINEYKNIQSIFEKLNKIYQ